MLFFPRADGLLMPMAGLLTCCTPCAFPCLHTVAKILQRACLQLTAPGSVGDLHAIPF